MTLLGCWREWEFSNSSRIITGYNLKVIIMSIFGRRGKQPIHDLKNLPQLNDLPKPRSLPTQPQPCQGENCQADQMRKALADSIQQNEVLRGRVM